MRAAAALSIDSKYASLSMSGKGERNDANQSSTNKVDGSSSLAWSARGGNTLLAANPAEWANSLASFQTWRTLEVSLPVVTAWQLVINRR
jgi:hypothetical protein